MTVKPIPDGHNAVSPYLLIQGAPSLIDFLKQTFDATELGRVSRPDGSIMHAEMKIGDSVVMLGEATDKFSPMPGMVHVYIADVDAVYQRALKVGATSLQEPTDSPDGDRRGGVLDPCGNQWWIATQIADVAWSST